MFVEPPRARSTLIAFSKASIVIIFLGVNSSSTIPTILTPESKAILLLSADPSRAVAHPAKDIPRASVTQAMVLAVYIPWHEPPPGHAQSSKSASSSVVISWFLYLPIASYVSLTKDRLFILYIPVCMGPAVTTMDGTFILAAAISIPGVILSQFVRRTRPSKAWAMATDSIMSAISSLEGRE